MCPPRPEAGSFHDHPVASRYALDARADARHFRDALIPPDCNEIGRAEGGGEGWLSGVDTLQLIDVGRVYWGGEKADCKVVGVRGRDRVRVQREDVGGVAGGREDERFGLLVAVG